MKKRRQTSISHYQQDILTELDIGILTVDEKKRIVFSNPALKNIFGLEHDGIIGKQCCTVFNNTFCSDSCLLQQTMDSGKSIVNKLMQITLAAGQTVHLNVNTALLRNKKGIVTGCTAMFRDLSIVGEMYSLPLHFWLAAETLRPDVTIEQIQNETARQYSFHGIISRSNEMRHIFALLPRIAESDSTILIEGPSGSGKELIAQTIHKLSARKNRPIITVNSGALPDTLLESELFGYKAGAFTDAKKDKPGRIALAEGGTLFLDEIGDISPSLQVRLLRFLQNKVYEPLGSTEPMQADVRILAATHRNLAQLVREGKFREDLYYRINVYKIMVPPLAKRKEDIPLLVKHFIDNFNRLRKKNIKGISSEAISILLNHDFPGNIRELQNIIEHAFILCSDGFITPAELPESVVQQKPIQFPQSSKTLTNIEKKTILEALKRNSGNRIAAAQELGIHKTTLWRKMKLLGIHTPDRKD